jgi:hypothetical protein
MTDVPFEDSEGNVTVKQFRNPHAAFFILRSSTNYDDK